MAIVALIIMSRGAVAVGEHPLYASTGDLTCPPLGWVKLCANQRSGLLDRYVAGRSSEQHKARWQPSSVF
jgi:hypothetical protein